MTIPAMLEERAKGSGAVSIGGTKISGMGNQQGGGLCSSLFGRMPVDTTITKTQMDQLVAMQQSLEQRVISYNETTNRKAVEMTQELLNELKKIEASCQATGTSLAISVENSTKQNLSDCVARIEAAASAQPVALPNVPQTVAAPRRRRE